MEVENDEIDRKSDKNGDVMCEKDGKSYETNVKESQHTSNNTCDMVLHATLTEWVKLSWTSHISLSGLFIELPELFLVSCRVSRSHWLRSMGSYIKPFIALE